MLSDLPNSREGGKVVGIVVEVADEHHRGPRPLRDGDVDGLLHPRGDDRAGGERVRPGVGGKRRQEAGYTLRRQREVADQGREVGGGRAGRERLVRVVGEHYESDALAGLREGPQRAADAREAVRGDAR